MHPRLPTHLVLPLAAALSAAAPALAAGTDDYPNHAIHIVVPYPPGGIADKIAREVAEALQQRWKQTVVVENRAGAAGNIGMDYVARQPADGYTLALAPASNLTVNPALFSHLTYDLDKDFQPLSLLILTPQALVVPPSLPVNSVQELIAYSKAHPDKVNFAAAGIGSYSHLAGELLRTETGGDFKAVPYQGAAPALNDLLGGQVQFMFNEVVTAAPHIKAGRLKALAIAHDTRVPWLPGVPTTAEAGLPGFLVSSWYGLVARRGTPAPVLARLSNEVQAIMKTPEMKQRYDDLGAYAIGSTPEEFATFIHSETDRWVAVVKRAHISLD